MRHHSSASLAALSIASLCFAADAHAVCATTQGNEQSLQQVFGTLLGADAPNVATGCVPDGADGQYQTSGPSTVTIVIEIAGFSNSNRFGIYDVLDPSNRFQLFGGTAGTGAQATIMFTPAGDGYTVTVGWPNNPSSPPSRSTTFGSSVFGFYLSTPEDNPNNPGFDRSVYFSETGLNYDGVDHMFAYRGNGAPFQSGPLEGEIFAPDSLLIAWEDLMGGGDFDYQDFVVYARSVTVVPLPPALALLLSGLGLIGGTGRRRRSSS